MQLKQDALTNLLIERCQPLFNNLYLEDFGATIVMSKAILQFNCIQRRFPLMNVPPSLVKYIRLIMALFIACIIKNQLLILRIR